jgi:hypothetical protein
MTPGDIVGWLIIGVIISIVWMCLYDAPPSEMVAAAIAWPLFLLLILYRGIRSAFINTFRDRE